MSWTDTGYAAYEAKYDRGKQTEIRYLDAQGHPALCNKGAYAVIKSKYDDFGRLTWKQYYGTEGEPVVDKESTVGGYQYEYSRDGGKWIELMQYLNTDGALMFRDEYGCAQIKKLYDETGRKIEETYLGLEGNPVARETTGCASIQNRYNDKGQLTEVRYLDEEGKLVMNKKEGYAVLKKEYNKARQLERDRYYDAGDQQKEDIPGEGKKGVDI